MASMEGTLTALTGDWEELNKETGIGIVHYLSKSGARGFYKRVLQILQKIFYNPGS